MYLKHNICNFVGILTIGTLLFGVTPGIAAQNQNPRGVAGDVSARTKTGNESGGTLRTSAANGGGRSVILHNVTVGGSGRVGTRNAANVGASRGATTVARNGTPAVVARSGTARSATVMPGANRSETNAGASRSALSRATAVFNDVTKIGGGYAACRDAYATCMDQFCANANDTYRRCFCSSRFTEFRDTEDALAQAKTLLMQFEDNNLNAVDKTAAEVDAMYSATVGEAAIKNDTSGAAKILDQIGDLLSGKASQKKQNASLGLISVDTISGEVDDIWGAGNDSSVFATRGAGQSLSELEGEALYNASNNQCVGMIADTCTTDAVLQMARSSYSIMITQDCNLYEKKINSQRESVKQTVRTAEKYLRDARLDEYRSHNSADVNECIARVKTAILSDSACGENYKRCLDNTGAYINATTGEPIYGPRLFGLTGLIKLDGQSGDVLSQNKTFEKFLDEKRKNAATALDTCRDIADEVWTEFKRSALIEIAQAQDEKIESVKMSCVSTMKQCYDDIGGQIKDFDDTTAQAAGAVGAYAARAMCEDKVSACAALYGNGSTKCTFDTTTGKITNLSACGLSALLTFVDTVDTTRVAEACEVAVDNYITDLCTPDDKTYKYPYNCRSLKLGDSKDFTYPYLDGTTDSNVATGHTPKTTLYAMVGRYVQQNCSLSNNGDSIQTNADSQIVNKVKLAIDNIESTLGSLLSDICTTTFNGLWVKSSDSVALNKAKEVEKVNSIKDIYKSDFYSTVFGGNRDSGTDWGVCINNSVEMQCNIQNQLTGAKSYATYNTASKQCVFTDGWYEEKCKIINGYWEDGVCYAE